MKKSLQKLYWASAIFAAAGLASGLFYRTFTYANDFTGDTQLAVVHTHLLMLGMFGFLIVMVLEKLFTLSQSKWFTLFFWHYCGGLVLSVATMVVIGMRTVLGLSSGAMFSGVSGLGHIILTVAIIFLFIALYKRITVDRA